MKRFLGASLLTLAALAAPPARADFALTQAAKDEGLTVTTFATGFPSAFKVGPLGIAFPTSGGVLVTDYPGNIRFFAADADNQVAPAPLIKYALGNAHDLATVGSHIYMDQKFNGDIVEINLNGTVKQTIVTGLDTPLALITDPITGHLLVSGGGGIFDVDPLAKTKTLLFNKVADGLTISDDGKTLYGAISGHILGFDLHTKAQVFDSGAIPGGPDGTVLGRGLLAGNIFSNDNDGRFLQFNLKTGERTVLATGGSRGDFTSLDPNYGSILLTQTDRILRIQGIRPVPEPAGFALVGSGLALVSWFTMRRKGRNRRGTGQPA